MTEQGLALLQRAATLADAAAPRSQEAESLRRLPDDLAKGLGSAGLLHLLTPAELGGHELHPAEFFAVVERLAQGDASLAWCSFIASTSAVFSAYLPRQSAHALFAGRPELACAGVVAPRGQARPEQRGGIDGHVVNGRWAWGSGTHHAELVFAGCQVQLPEGQPAQTIWVTLRREQVRLLDNWHSMGLQGSGSGEFEVNEAFVPSNLTANLMSAPWVQTPLYRFPVFGLLALSIAAVASGVARRSIDELLLLAGAKVPQGAARPLAQRAATQEALARAQAQWASARAYVDAAVAKAWAQAHSGQPIGLHTRAEARLAATHMVHTAAEVARRMFTLAGGSAVFASSPLQRCLRDAHVATQHMMVAEPTYELIGRVQLGLQVQAGQL